MEFPKMGYQRFRGCLGFRLRFLFLSLSRCYVGGYLRIKQMTKANARKNERKEKSRETKIHTRVSGRAFWRRRASSSGLRVLVTCITPYPITPGTTPHMVAKARKKGLDSFVLLTSHLHVALFSNSIDIQYL
jgi:hypothetical protein